MLPTQKGANFKLGLQANNSMKYCPYGMKSLGVGIPQHLYVISATPNDTFPRERHWVTNGTLVDIFGFDFGAKYSKEQMMEFKEILASSNEELNKTGQLPIVPMIQESFFVDYIYNECKKDVTLIEDKEEVILIYKEYERKRKV